MDVFLACLLLGGGVLAVQIVLSVAGVGGDTDLDHSAAEDGVDLLSVRSLSAATLMFGATGLWLDSFLPWLLAVGGGIAAGFAAAYGTAWLTRQMLRLESSGSFRLEEAVGRSATVYLPVPALGEGFGKVQFELQGRTLELRAVAHEAAALPTGSPVLVIAVLDGDTVEVVPTPLIEGVDA